VETPVIGLTAPDRQTGLQQPIFGPKTTVNGFRLIDARALIRTRPGDIPDWLPGPFRLVLENPAEQRLRRRRLCIAGRPQRVQETEVRALDRLRLLVGRGQWAVAVDLFALLLCPPLLLAVDGRLPTRGDA
jgi:hypothetical protein